MKKINGTTVLIRGTEWFARLAVLNLIWLLFSLPLFTIIPATYTLFAVLQRLLDGEDLDKSIYFLFKNKFISSFKESYRIGFSFIVMGIWLTINLLFFFIATSTSPWFHIFKTATIFLAILYTFLFFYSFALSIFIEERPLHMIGTAFIIMLSQPGYTGMVGLSIIFSTIIFDFFPALLFFFPMSGISLLFLKATKRGYHKLILKIQTK